MDFEAGVGGQDTLPQHTFRMGDIVGVEEHVSVKSSKQSSNKQPHRASGVVYKLNDKRMTVSFKQDEEPADYWQFVRM